MSFGDEVTAMLRNVRILLAKIDVRDLPHVPVDDLDFTRMLPETDAVYFLISAVDGLLYIGRATNLRRRWYVNRQVSDTSKPEWPLCHHALKPALDLGDVQIHWLLVGRDQLAIIESLLIQLYQPPWNTHER